MINVIALKYLLIQVSKNMFSIVYRNYFPVSKNYQQFSMFLSLLQFFLDSLKSTIADGSNS